MKIINSFNEMKVREVLDCRITSFREALRYEGINATSYDLVLLSQVLSFNLAKVKLEGVGVDYCIIAGASDFNIERKLFANLNVGYEKITINNDDDGINEIKKYIQDNIPILCKIDSRFIENPYYTVKSSNILNLYNPSILLVVGIDLSEDMIYVVLNNTDTMKKPYGIKIEDFQKYRNSLCFPFPPNNECYILRINNKEIKIYNENKKEIILKAINEVCLEMLNIKQIQVNLNGMNSLGIYTGINGIKELINEVKLLRDALDESNSLSVKILKLKVIILRSNFLQGTLTCYRKEFGESLKAFGKEFNIIELIKIGDDFIYEVKLWRGFIRSLSAIIDNVNKLEYRLVKSLNSLIEIEKSEIINFKNLHDVVIKNLEGVYE